MAGRRRWIIGGAVTMLLVATIGVTGRFWAVPNWRPDLRAGERYGIDVAAHQGTIDWSAVEGDGISFAYLKASEGGDFVDRRFASNWHDAAAAGLDRGAYHFFTLCRSGADQARHFLDTVPVDPEALAPAVDLELAGNCSERPSRAAVSREVDAFLDRVEVAWGRKVVLYVGDDWDRAYPTRARLDRPVVAPADPAPTRCRRMGDLADPRLGAHRRDRRPGRPRHRPTHVLTGTVSRYGPGTRTAGAVMGRLIYVSNTSLDGCTEEASGAFTWAPPDDEVFAATTDLIRTVGTHVLGRRMYELMALWETDPTLAQGSELRAAFATAWQDADKVVCSTTLATPSTARTRLERQFDPEAIRQLTAASVKDVMVSGPNLAAQAWRAGLLDECHLFVWPMVLGGRNRALPEDVRSDLTLLDEHRFTNGVVHLRYQVA